MEAGDMARDDMRLKLMRKNAERQHFGLLCYRKKLKRRKHEAWELAADFRPFKRLNWFDYMYHHGFNWYRLFKHVRLPRCSRHYASRHLEILWGERITSLDTKETET